ncbi:lytic transglycosylase domain-containing protein [Actinomadura sp. 3N508]|uniref:aggregation-promoting factor C-terminal-like domain-containing protein n=1 Tax=Actinomadura sp. 3N508 TaxID=3375153 RepID=UPI00378F3C58
MYGDRPGSPRRDERQHFDPQGPWQSAPSAPAQPVPAPAEPPAPHVPIQATGAFAAPPAPPEPYAPSDPYAAPPDPYAPSDPLGQGDPFGQPAPHEDDVKVAGSAPPQAGAAPAGDTLGFQPLPPEALRTGASAEPPRDEIVSGRRAQHSSGGRGGSGGRNGMRIAAIAAIAAGAAVVVGVGAVAAFALTGGSGGEATVKPNRQLADAAPKVDPKVLEEQRRQLALDRASRATRQDQGETPSLHPKGKPIPTKKPDGDGGGPIGDPVPAGEAQEIAKRLMPSFGFTGDGQFGCLVKLWNKESHWNVHADNPSSEAYGIPQANPGSKMASAGPDWQNNATTQIKWGLGYIKGRYDTPCGAWSHSQSVGWY